MKKTVIWVLLLAMICTVFVSCGEKEKDDVTSVVCTTFASYDWVKNISDGVGNIEIKLLSDGGADMHSYSPSVKDIADISSCDVFIYVGGESDAWVEGAVSGAQNKDMKTICLIDVLGDRAEKEHVPQGAETDHVHDHSHNVSEYDEHVWLSLRNAVMFCEKIRDTMIEADGANRNRYEANAASYMEKLKNTDKKYSDIFEKSESKTLIFADRYPFCYLVRDYGFDAYAAFPGCSAESDASFGTIINLAGKADSAGVGVLLIIEGSDGKVAEAVRNNTATKDQRIMTLDSMQSITGKPDEKSYLDTMKANFEVILTALGIVNAG